MKGRESRLVLFRVTVMCLLLHVHALDKLGSSIIKYIYSHEELCGDQFEDPLWMPAHDQCSLECDLISEICQIASNTALIINQRCKSLPHACAENLQSHLYNISLVDTRRSTSKQKSYNFQEGITISGTTGEATQYHTTNKPMRPYGLNVKQLEPVTVTSSPDDEVTLVENDVSQATEEPFNTASYRGMIAGEGLFDNAHEDASSTSSPFLFDPTTSTSAPEYEDPQVDGNSIFEAAQNPFDRVQPDQTTEAYRIVGATDPRLEMPPAVPTPPQEVHIFGPPFVEKQRYVEGPTAFILLRGTTTLKVDESATERNREWPHTLEQLNNQRKNRPWSWRELTNKIRRPYSLENRPNHDLSNRCCQWALDGLCDRSWQRVRVLCPKSCGSVVCSSVDGAVSCNRAIDVNVAECYEKRHTHMHSISSRFYHAEDQYSTSYTSFDAITTETRSAPVPHAWLENQRSREGGALYPAGVATSFSRAPPAFSRTSGPQRAYAVEDEIRQFKNKRFGR